MKKAISAVIGIIFAVVQAFLPLTEESVLISYRILSAGVFALVWILYTVFSETIETFICRSILGRSLHKKSVDEKNEYFRNRIVPNIQSLQKKSIDGCDEFTKNFCYNNWCETIDFILMDCCKNEKNIDNTIVTIGDRRYAKIFRNREIDIFYLNSIIEVLCKFEEENHLVILKNIDYLDYSKRLKIVKELIKNNLG